MNGILWALVKLELSKIWIWVC